VAEAPNERNVFDVECPHCHKHFRTKLLEANSPRHAGFKCPHCRLFVAYDRAGDSERT
jgi:transposase-like protein